MVNTNQDKPKYKILGIEYDLPLHDAHSGTKERILMKATILFGRNGYSAVSMRDIAKEVGIKPSSLYNHFSSKEALWEHIIEHAVRMYLLYFERLGEILHRAQSLEEVLEFLFSEPRKLANIFTSYAYVLIQCEQFHDHLAGKVFTGTFMEYSINFLKHWFDKCIARGWTESFDSRSVAITCMNNIFMGLDMEVQMHMGRKVPYHPTQMFADLQQFLLTSLKKPDNA